MEKDCQITLYLDTPKPLLRPFKDFIKHNQLASLFVYGAPDPAEITGHAFIGLTDAKGRETRFGYTGEGKMSKMISGVDGVVKIITTKQSFGKSAKSSIKPPNGKLKNNKKIRGRTNCLNATVRLLRLMF